MTAYGDFASLYDQLMNDVDYEKWFNYIEEIFERNGKKPRTILEMACGTGNLTEFFCKENYEVTCFDLSEEMLTVASSKLSSYRNVNILKQDMTELNLSDNKFEVIVSACDSINYIISLDDLLRVFKNAYNHLEQGGLFVFDINSYFKLKNVIGENIFVEDQEDIFYVWDNEFLEEEQLCNFYLTFFVKEDGLYRRFDETHVERAYQTEEILDALKKSGFKKVDYYDEFTFDDVKEKSERIFFTALK